MYTQKTLVNTILIFATFNFMNRAKRLNLLRTTKTDNFTNPYRISLGFTHSYWPPTLMDLTSNSVPQTPMILVMASNHHCGN